VKSTDKKLLSDTKKLGSITKNKGKMKSDDVIEDEGS